MTTGRINQGASCVRSLALGERHAPVSRPYVRTSRASSSGVFAALAVTRERKTRVCPHCRRHASRSTTLRNIYLFVDSRESQTYKDHMYVSSHSPIIAACSRLSLTLDRRCDAETSRNKSPVRLKARSKISLRRTSRRQERPPGISPSVTRVRGVDVR